MNLKNLVIEKLGQLGSEAEAYFGKSSAALRLWKSTGKIPLDAVQKVYDEMVVEEKEIESSVDSKEEDAEKSIAILWAHIKEHAKLIEQIKNNQFGPNFNASCNTGTCEPAPPLNTPLPSMIPDEAPQSFVQPAAMVIPPSGPTPMETKVIGHNHPVPQLAPPPTIPGQPGAWNTPHVKKQ